MSATEPRVLRPGEPAPDFTLPTVHREGTVSLAEFRGQRAVLLAFFRGIYCPFCRRQIAKLALVRERLLAAGTEALAVVASDLERTRLYFRYRPTRLPLAVDPAMTTHRAYGIGKLPVTPELLEAIQTTRTDVMGELPAPLPIMDAAHALQERDGFQLTAADDREAEEQFPMDTGHVLVDRAGIVRWVNLELARSGVAALGTFPSDEELLAVVRGHVA
jgi:peroxiredoxin